MDNIKEIIQQKPINNCDVFGIKYKCAWDGKGAISENDHKCLQKIKICKKCGNFMCSYHITTNLNECAICKFGNNLNQSVEKLNDIAPSIFMCKKCGIDIKFNEKKINHCSFGHLCYSCFTEYSHEETCFQI